LGYIEKTVGYTGAELMVDMFQQEVRRDKERSDELAASM